MPKRIAVVISQGQSSNPGKRQLEEDVVMGLMLEPGIDVTIVPHLYDVKPDSTGHLAMSSIQGNLVVLSWLYERATRWVLDRNGIRGMVGTVQLKVEDEDGDDESDEEIEEDSIKNKSKSHVVDTRETPKRFIYCIDLRVSNKPQDFIDEIKRIRTESSVSVVNLGSSTHLPIVSVSANGSTNSSLPKQASHLPSGFNNEKLSPDSIQRIQTPTNDTALPFVVGADGTLSLGSATITRVEEDVTRRWYPVIDFSRCTNCMECIDFCLFGVYGVDPMETILVEQPDNCRKGCPACSRVCPENAIMFPLHKTPAIAGANEAAEALKIDLSQLFGAPAEAKTAIEIAAAERDEQLLLAGRDAVGFGVGIPKRQSDKVAAPRDELDDLVDQLDNLDL